MGFFRLGKLDRSEKDKERTDSPTADHAGPAAGAAAPAPAALAAALGAADASKAEKKKKLKDGQDAAGGAAAAGDGRAVAGPALRAQAGLSVNDFISKTKNQQRQGLKPSGPELIAYARYLGIDPVADHDLLWIAVEALEAPLPSDWTEHFDSNDRVFYYNATTRVSSWTHPLEHIYRETYKTIVNFRNSNLAPQERSDKLHQLQAEVKQMEQDVHKEIAQWSEHTDEQGNRFYFNREERQSTWTDPRPAKCQILYLRMKMLRLLQSGAGATAGFTDSKGEGLSRFGALPAGGSEFDDPAHKRSKLAGSGTNWETEAKGEHDSARRSPQGGSAAGSEHSDSDSSDDRKAKKRRKKKKKKDKDGVRLGAPQKLGTSQSEPSVGSKPLLAGAGGHDAGGGGAGGAMLGRSPRGGATGAGASGTGVSHIALGGLSPLDESGLSMAGRARVKAGIRLEPIGPGGQQHPPPGGSGGAAYDPAAGSGGRGVRNSASVPAL